MVVPSILGTYPAAIDPPIKIQQGAELLAKPKPGTPPYFLEIEGGVCLIKFFEDTLQHLLPLSHIPDVHQFHTVRSFSPHFTRTHIFPSGVLNLNEFYLIRL